MICDHLANGVGYTARSILKYIKGKQKSLGCPSHLALSLFVISISSLTRAQGPYSHITMMGGGGVRVFFLGLKILAKGDFFGSMKGHRDFFGSRRKTEGFFWVVKKGLRDLLKKVVIFLGRQILKL